ncbi:metallophosphoesterase [Aestuariibacter salexigens]|uniref:metallophosphoesterase n=1 Tax=Aestuariibacter salexigens TaxID=226010 RepID=UPI0004283FEF|nr:metallophosphoesterase [Aestuariibacter salexigens]
MSLFLAALWLLFLMGCSPAPPPVINTPQSVNIQIPFQDVRFIVLGDWGNYGGTQQRDVASAMNSLAGNQRVDFILTTGDNFYDQGVRDIHDPLWLQSYENIYNLTHLRDLDWYVTVGNHDHKGSVAAQQQYHQSNPRWHLPSLYYPLYVDFMSGHITIAMLDTNQWITAYVTRPDRYANLHTVSDGKQQVWLRDVLSRADSQNDWSIVVGHHPLYGAGKYGDNAELQTVLEPLFQRYQVTAYFAGHEHSLQHHKSRSFTHHFVSGAGGKLRDIESTDRQTRFASATAGFAYVTVSEARLQVEFINADNQRLYHTDIKKGPSEDGPNSKNAYTLSTVHGSYAAIL